MKSGIKAFLFVTSVAASVAVILYAVYDFFIASTISFAFIGGLDGPTVCCIGGRKN